MTNREQGRSVPIIQAGFVEAAVRARDLARKNVAAEQQKYELGTITAFEVLDSQTRLASYAERSKIKPPADPYSGLPPYQQMSRKYSEGF
ncbi:MAG TPA: hypothetical protein VH477_12330 [Bryobacteraceae bacterium]|jgi:hypothetical protein